jgi:hypothetical protein
VKHVVMFSGGIGSWAAGRRVVDAHGPENVELLFTDTLIEDEDLYRFLPEAAAELGARLVRISDGRTPWELFRQKKFLGNTRVDLCSRVLKRELADRWMEAQHTPETVTVHVGIDWTEEHRFTRLQARKLPWRYEAPLLSPPYLTKDDMIRMAREAGLEPPRLYAMGFAHNNCGGGCVKAGQAHFRHLLLTIPDRYREWEREEELLREELGDVSILRDRRGGETVPLPLREFRRRLEADDQQCDLLDWGGCGCFSGPP